MATAVEVEVGAEEMSLVEQIGETAGVIWHYLSDHGATSLTKLVRGIDAPRDTVMLAVGWLAREDKILIAENGRSRVISLK